MALWRSLSRSFARRSSLSSFLSSTKKPPFEFTIFDRSKSKYFPSRESRRSGCSFDAFGAVGDVDVAGVTSSGRLLFAFNALEDDEAASSRSLCFAFAERRAIELRLSNPEASGGLAMTSPYL